MELKLIAGYPGSQSKYQVWYLNGKLLCKNYLIFLNIAGRSIFLMEFWKKKKLEDLPHLQLVLYISVIFHFRSKETIFLILDRNTVVLTHLSMQQIFTVLNLCLFNVLLFNLNMKVLQLLFNSYTDSVFCGSQHTENLCKLI